MRIGIDVEILKASRRDGLVVHLWNVIAALHALPNRPSVWLFANNDVPEMLLSLQSSIPNFQVVEFRGLPRGRLSRLRMRLHPLSRLDVFQHFVGGFPILPGQLNSFFIPDLSPIHLAGYHTEENRNGFQNLFAVIRRQADLVITYSEHTRQDVATTLGIPIERIRAIPLAPAAHFRPLPEEKVRRELARRGLEYGRYILTVGTLEPRKNHKLLFQAYSKILANRAVPHLPLVVVGGKGWGTDEIFDSVAQLGIRDSVRFLGFAEGLEHFYNGARVMVYPSLFEGFGLPPLEAMACGTPVIISNAASLPEVVGDAGVMVDPSDAEGLAAALEAVLTDDRLHGEMRAKGLARAKMFSWTRYAQELVASYRSLQGQRTRKVNS